MIHTPHTELDSAELILNADQVKASIRNTLAKDSAYYFSLLQDCETQQECLEAMAEFVGDTDLPIESKRGFYNDTLTFYKWQEAEINRSIYADFVVLCDITANELLEWSALELTRLAQGA